MSDRPSPNMARSATGSCTLPNVMPVAGDPTTMPPYWSPMKVIRSPIPPAIPRFRLSGMNSINFARNPTKESRTKTQPPMKTAVSPCCQEKPRTPTTTKVKYALWPIAGARAIG